MSTTSNLYNTEETRFQKPSGEQYQPGTLDKAHNLATGTGEAIHNATTSDSTTHYRNQQSHVGGVGDLGTTGNTDVVRLPEERAAGDTAQPQQPGYVQQAYEGAASLASTAVNTISSAFASASVPPTVKSMVGADPTTQYRNKQPHIGGVGDLGTTSEVDVTRLPEERAHPDPFAEQRAAMHSDGVGDLGTKSEVDVVRLPDERVNPDPLVSSTTSGAITSLNRPNERSSVNDWDDRTADPAPTHQYGHSKTGHIKGVVHDVTQPGHSGGVTGSNHDVDHGLGMEHREGDTAWRPDQPKVATGYDAGTHQPLKGAGADDEASPSSPTKMDKLKGRIMIAKGKLTKDQEEIEQGKRLKETGKAVDVNEILKE